MSTKKRVYTAEFKTKIVLEALKNEKTVSSIASTYNITPKNITNWKTMFLANAEMAMEPAKVVKEYKAKIADLEDKNDKYAKVVGKMTIEQEWMEKKLESLDLSKKKELIESKHESMSITTQCKLLKLNKSSFYYKATPNEKKELIQSQIENIFKDAPMYGAIKVYKQLLDDGIDISLNTVESYRQEMGLKAILAVKKTVNTTVAIKEHKKYSYLLRGLDITKANQVWSTDITYIRINGGMVYLAAIIDWYSKAILSYHISNTMDTELVMDVLNEALDRYGQPDIFNTDQGSQYTSKAHTQALSERQIHISMDGKGRATDNICIERFWRSAKCEKIYLNEYDTVKKLKDDVAEYIEFYNHRRLHQTLDYKKPMNVYFDSLKIEGKYDKYRTG
jgi:putative transposase